MTTATKAKILDSLAKVTGGSFIAYSIGLFVRDAHMKTDPQVATMITQLQDQIIDNPSMMMRVLGSQYDFLRTVRVKGEVPVQAVG